MGTFVRNPAVRDIYSYKLPGKYFRFTLGVEPTTTSNILLDIRGIQRYTY